VLPKLKPLLLPLLLRRRPLLPLLPLPLRRLVLPQLKPLLLVPLPLLVPLLLLGLLRLLNQGVWVKMPRSVWVLVFCCCRVVV
jgi:hypothetical protein